MDEVVGVEGVLPDRAAARRAIDRMSRAGIDGGRIHAIAPVEAVGIQGVRDTDRSTMGVVGSRVLRGVGVGVAIGAVAGAVLVGPLADAGTFGFVAGAGGGAVAGLFTGALTGAMTVPTMSRAWQEVSAQPAGAPVRLLVVAKGDADQLTRHLTAAGAAGVRQVLDRGELP